MPLVTANQYKLTPDLGGAINTGLNVYNTIQSNQRANQNAALQGKLGNAKIAQQQAATQKQNALQMIVAKALGLPMPPSSQADKLTGNGMLRQNNPAIMSEAGNVQVPFRPTESNNPALTGGRPVQNQPTQADYMKQLMVFSPETADAVMKSIGIQNQMQADQAAKFSYELSQVPYEQRAGKIQARAEMLRSQGRDPKDTLSLLDMDQKGQDTALMATQFAALSAKDRLAITNPKTTATSLQKNLVAAGFTPGTPEYQAAVRKQLNKSNATTVNVNTGNQLNKSLVKEAEAEGKVWADRLGDTLSKGDQAEETISVIQQMKLIDVDSGALSNVKLKMAALAKDAGFEGLASSIANVSEGQAFKALQEKLVNAVLNQAKGPQTDADAARVRQTIAGITDDKQALQFKLRSAEAFSNRSIEKADFVRSLKIKAREGGGFMSTAKAESEWKKYAKENPLLADVAIDGKSLPMFFNEFKQEILRNNPDAEKEEINQLWMMQVKGK